MKRKILKLPKGKKPAASSVLEFTTQDFLGSQHGNSATFTVESVSKDHRRVCRETHVARPPSPVKKKMCLMTAEAMDQHFENLACLNEAMPFAGIYAEDEEVFVGERSRAKRYISSDEPLKLWIPKRDEYMAVLVSMEASEHIGKPCSHCPGDVEPGVALFRCARDCFEREPVCQQCCVFEHAQLPLHWVERWNGLFFERVSLRELGLRVQLGHGGNIGCPQRKQEPQKFTVIDSSGIHTVSVDFCQCHTGSTSGEEWKQLLLNNWFPATHLEPQTATTIRCLKQFHILTFTGKITPYDYYTSLERLSNNTACKKVPDRYRGFIRTACEFRHLRACKRAGRGNDDVRKIDETFPGEIAVECPACPRPGINLPENWESMPKDQKFIYTLFIAVDACFRLKRKMVSSDMRDPGLGTGWAYFVEEAPYREYYKTLGDQTEMNSCTGLSAVDHANTRFSRGYAVTGVGLALCARHEFIGKNGVGDLQKGEKYGNMTYVVASFLQHIHALLLKLVSYDINCQFSKNFASRVQELPPLVRFVVISSLFRWVIPKLHILGHKLSCQREFNLNYTSGAGRTDGEGVERPWANIGPVATSTREMGGGHRHDTLDDHWGDWNWRKLVGLVKLLARRQKVANEELAIQEHSFATFCVNQVDDVEEWEKAVVDWEADSTKPNPYESKKSSLSIHEVRLQLSTEESVLAESGLPSVHDTSTAEFLLIGLDLEEQQRRLRQEVNAIRGSLTTKQQADLVDKRNRITRQITKFRTLQAVYMPGSVQILVDLAKVTVKDRDGNIVPPPAAERMMLLFPSDLSPAQRAGPGMMTCLDKLEGRLREAQLEDALSGLRNQLLIKSRLLTYKTVNVRHQGATSRSRSLIDRNEAKVQLFARRYQAAWDAKLKLAGGVDLVGWRKLNATDIKCIPQEETKEQRDSRLRKKRKHNVVDSVADREPEGHRILSWIWTEGADAGFATDEALRDGLCVEWAKAWSRVRRWREEVLLLSEEMRRVLVSFEWTAKRWESRADLPGFSGLRAAGAAAYASKQAAIYRGLAVRCRSLWNQKPQDSVLPTVATHAGIPAELEGEEAAAEEEESLAQETLHPEDDPIWE
ncbi:hypothetical protein C8J56DRAFT_1043935 [Mycena floridula]|nr:hypothetical protein C8J56DRAFT_1043935 [Mycena floridula]